MELTSLSTNPLYMTQMWHVMPLNIKGLFCVTLCHTTASLPDKRNFFQSLKWPKDLTILLPIGLKYMFLQWPYRKCPYNCQHRVQLLSPLGLVGLAISLRWLQSPPYHSYSFHHLEWQLSVHVLNHWDWSIPLKSWCKKYSLCKLENGWAYILFSIIALVPILPSTCDAHLLPSPRLRLNIFPFLNMSFFSLYNT